MLPELVVSDPHAIPIFAVTARTWHETAADQGPSAAGFAAAHGFDGSPDSHCVLPTEDGRIACVLFGIDQAQVDLLAAGGLPPLLPSGVYRLVGFPGEEELAALAFLLGGYRFERYRRKPSERALGLALSASVDPARLAAIAGAVAFGRDLINTPANDLGPGEIEAAARALAGSFDAQISSIVGDALLEQNFPMVHAVGRASSREPRLIDLVWGDPSHPKVTLVGKGVAFDTGGLNIKPESAMLLMKKDMGGGASALAAARMIMACGCKVRLRVIIPAVENAISGSAFRPGDVLASRKGLSIEIGNTDAEGRLILADALALADEEAPDLLVDFATLTGAARVALGPDLPPLFTDDDALAGACETVGRAVADPVWRLPLWKPYDLMLRSKIADISHIASSPFAGSITAALFLRRFVEQARSYAHFDIFGWTPSARPGRPQGGEPQTARLVHALIEARYGVAASRAAPD